MMSNVYLTIKMLELLFFLYKKKDYIGYREQNIIKNKKIFYECMKRLENLGFVDYKIEKLKNGILRKKWIISLNGIIAVNLGFKYIFENGF